MKTFDLDGRIAGWRGPVLAALLTLIAGLPGLLLLPPLDRDESRFAQATSQMLESGDYVDIRYQDEPRWKKPVGIYWMQAVAVGLTSDVEDREIAPYRIPSLLGAMLAAWAVAWAGSAMLGGRVGFFGGAIMGATFLLSTEAGIAKTDAMLCGATTLAMAALARIYMATKAGERPIRPHKLLFWIGIGLSILIKGPIGFLVVALAIIALSIWDRNIKWLYRLGWGWGLPLVALMVGPWAIAITIATDGGFWREAIGGDLAPKIAGAHESHSGFPGMYLLLAPLLFFPSTLLLPAAVSTGWARRAEPAIRFLVCWLVPGWLMFELAPTKLWHYTLPTFGALALLAAAALAQPIGKVSRITGAVLGAFAALLIIGITVYGLTVYGTSTAQTWAALTVVMALAAGAMGGFLLLNRAPVAALVASLAFGIVAHAALSGTIRQLRPLAIAPQLEKALEAADLHPRQGRTPGPVVITGFHEPSFVFLTGRDTDLTDAQG
ncbi:glycosyltransferase family 39 protein, partial [uncultured Brevundimonas sp.]|uniref:ArnT family glycosyltransferase n=1 Tax=uncultured Brevundimonas sp. TaxID=213418 RepID=UPI0025D61BAC